MKRIFSMFVFILLLVPTIAIAQEEELPDAGTTPDSILYGLDKAFESISLALTFNKAAKAEKRLQMASERLSELKVMTDKGKPEYFDDLADEYDNNIRAANEIATTAKLLREDKSKLTELVALATSKHLSVLDKVKENVPEQAKEAITKAKEASMNGQKNALKALSEDKPEKAAEIHSKAAEARLNRAKEKAEENEVEEVEDEIEEFEKLANFGNEISQIAQGLGKDTTTVDQLVAKATTRHLDVLAEVYAKVPDQAKAAIESAMAKSTIAREKSVEALKNKGALGNIPEEVPTSVSDKISDDVKERVGIKGKPETTGKP